MTFEHYAAVYISTQFAVELNVRVAKQIQTSQVESKFHSFLVTFKYILQAWIHEFNIEQKQLYRLITRLAIVTFVCPVDMPAIG